METRGKPPQLHFGDYPHGRYLSAVAPEGAPADDDDDYYNVEGPDLRIMWDEGAGPLWSSSDGLLPDEPKWMRRALGLSDTLIADLLSWLSEMTAFQTGSPGLNWRTRERQLNEQAEELADRLQSEVGDRYEVRYHP